MPVLAPYPELSMRAAATGLLGRHMCNSRSIPMRLETPAEVRHELGWRQGPQAVYLNGERLTEVREISTYSSSGCVTIVFGPVYGKFSLVKEPGCAKP